MPPAIHTWCGVCGHCRVPVEPLGVRHRFARSERKAIAVCYNTFELLHCDKWPAVRRGAVVFSALTTCYLFLGGTGAGAAFVLGLLELAAAGQGAQGPAVEVARRFALPDDLFARAWPACFVVLALGVLCLLLDLGRPDRLLNLVASPAPTPVAVGSYALAAALVLAGGFSLGHLLDGAPVPLAAVRACAAAAVVAGAVAAVYTGVLLQGLASVLAWQTPLVPALFALSAASCGIACVFGAAAFVGSRTPVAAQMARLARIDGALIAAEALCLASWLAWALADEGAARAAIELLAGCLAWAFWGVLAGCGLAAPFAAERLLARDVTQARLLGVAASVLAGGAALRVLVAACAAFDVTQMPEALFGVGFPG